MAVFHSRAWARKWAQTSAEILQLLCAVGISRILLVTPSSVSYGSLQWMEVITVLASRYLAHMQCIYLSPGQAALPLLQHTRQGDGAHQVLPRILLRMSEDALRHPTEEVPQVQLCLRSQRLSPHLHHLIRGETEERKEKTVDGTKGGKRVEKRRRNWRFIQRGRHFGDIRWVCFPCFILSLERLCFTTSLPVGD